MFFRKTRGSHFVVTLLFLGNDTVAQDELENLTFDTVLRLSTRLRLVKNTPAISEGQKLVLQCFLWACVTLLEKSPTFLKP